MISSDVEIMLSEEFRQSVLGNVERDPVAVAMDKHIANASLVATQVKYLQRARHKLPRLYEAGCVIPPRAFEQSSSEESANIKDISGGRLFQSFGAIDGTLGLNTVHIHHIGIDVTVLTCTHSQLYISAIADY